MIWQLTPSPPFHQNIPFEAFLEKGVTYIRLAARIFNYNDGATAALQQPQ
jgi:hypothetical protein